MKHTKGKWKLDKWNHIVDSNEKEVIFYGITTISGYTESKEYLANTKLAAAAPDMIEALQEAYKELEFHNWHNTKTGLLIQQVIKRATE